MLGFLADNRLTPQGQTSSSGNRPMPMTDRQTDTCWTWELCEKVDDWRGFFGSREYNKGMTRRDCCQGTTYETKGRETVIEKEKAGRDQRFISTGPDKNPPKRGFQKETAGFQAKVKSLQWLVRSARQENQQKRNFTLGSINAGSQWVYSTEAESGSKQHKSHRNNRIIMRNNYYQISR